ncbi:Hypothetical protein PHPALM_1370 [Phytophthora palmivora]|uniref:Integrase zinc-binding domain-containing protein n=1 Tax=Phytophthora palmivora TaxID=4796 RepID=A0A2P4YSI3_9STRA|nr:Hypothetical protein PHPALM_1370 [Phytophthora palmivora]
MSLYPQPLEYWQRLPDPELARGRESPFHPWDPLNIIAFLKDDKKTAKVADLFALDVRGVLYRFARSTRGRPRDAGDELRLVVPESLREDMLHYAHEDFQGGHQGITRTHERLRSEFYWPGVYADVERFVKECVDCASGQPGLSRKLAHLWHGPFRIEDVRDDFRVKQKVEDSRYRVKLKIEDSRYRVNPWVHISRLKPRAIFPRRPKVGVEIEDDADFDAALLPEDSWEPDNANDEYDVESIQDWKGYADPEWIPVSQLSCGALLYEFNKGARSSPCELKGLF